MTTDDRDERLGTMLDDVVGDLRPRTPAADRVMRRGSSRRLATVTASALTVAVFVAAIGFAATQIGTDAGDGAVGTATSATFVSPDYRWTMPVPAGWHAFATRSVGGPRDMVQELRTSLVTDSAADLRGVLWFASKLPPDVADSDVIVFVDPFVGTGAAGPTSLVLGADRDDDVNAGWTWRDGKVCGPTGCARVYLWHGPDAGSAAVEAGLGIAQGVRLEGSRPQATVLTPTVAHQDLGRNPFWIEYPAGWTLAEESLTAGLVDPRELVSIGSYPLRSGGTAPTDAFLPGNAIADIGPDDVFLTVQESLERSGGLLHPPRPSRFGPVTGCAPADATCVDGGALAIDGLRAWWIPFSDQDSGRDFYAFVAMGDEAYGDPARSAAVWGVLDSMAFDRRQPPVELPPPVRDDYRSEFVSDELGSRFWPRSGPAERGVVYRFVVPHCGLDWMVDLDGSFWGGSVIVDAGPGWIPIERIPVNDVGTLELLGRKHARYEASDGRWTLLSRIAGPIVRRPCE